MTRTMDDDSNDANDLMNTTTSSTETTKTTGGVVVATAVVGTTTTGSSNHPIHHHHHPNTSTTTMTTTSSTSYDRYRIPHESEPHDCTWMVYSMNKQIWGSSSLIKAVQSNLRTIAISIASQKECVKLLVRSKDYNHATKEFQNHIIQWNDKNHMNDTTVNGTGTVVQLNVNIRLIPIDKIDDIWIRDTGPIFVYKYNNQSNNNSTVLDKQNERSDFVVKGHDDHDDHDTVPIALCGIDCNFNGWGNKQPHKYDHEVAQYIIQYINNNQNNSNTNIITNNHTLNTNYCEYRNASIVMEGGGMEVDGYGTAIIIESCIKNQNRNPVHYTYQYYESILLKYFGIQKVIWLPGRYNDPYDITDMHVDGYIRFVNSTTIVMAYDEETDENNSLQQQHLHILQQSTNAQNETLNIVIIPNPKLEQYYTKIYQHYPEYCATYINYYLCNSAILVPQFIYDRNADQYAITIFQTQLFPNRIIIPIDISKGIAIGGGGIHCVTQQQPRKCKS
jgi:agmatine deiminase